MTIEIEDESVNISMPSKVYDGIQGVNGINDTPAGLNFFPNDSNSNLFNEHMRQKFHTLTAKLLYIAKRTRPDILLAVNFLTTRVQAPTVEDQTKLYRILK